MSISKNHQNSVASPINMSADIFEMTLERETAWTRMLRYDLRI
jgi:hypothetical protein